ncbi:DUF998 domain-containing protein [Microbispora sp. RL4-1S]|uniref:DUF998 domain-containing protein n=1 Tax=Microbispora oryzae TaxID=2806554 RepID=A0A941AM00_9ACTN|nr:DUF998 domain-containing protein [Microbispora oryzae]MBP2708641.1 DUF998 domain-containing protein [Microbispora oryzae]
MVKRLYPVVACAGILVAIVTVVTTQVGGRPGLDPVSMPISRYAAEDGGGTIELAMAVLGLASLALLAGLRRAGAPISGWPTWLVGLWGAALIGAAVVPSAPPELGHTWQENVHLVLSAVAFVSVPLAATLMVGRLGDDELWKPVARAVEWLTLAAGLGLAAITYVALPGHGVAIGIVERLLLTAEVAILAVLAVRLLQVVWAPVVEAPAVESPAVAAPVAAAPVAAARVMAGRAARAFEFDPATARVWRSVARSRAASAGGILVNGSRYHQR